MIVVTVMMAMVRVFIDAFVTMTATTIARIDMNIS